jgi:hypothetical protein
VLAFLNGGKWTPVAEFVEVESVAVGKPPAVNGTMIVTIGVG